MPRSIRSAWSQLDCEYTDEHGRIAPDIYHAAGRLRQQALSFARSSLGDDEEQAQALLLRAAAQVTRATNARRR
jgi:hypothetical protein